MRVMIRRMGPMIQQMQVPCPDCNGQGTTLDDADRCTVCVGRKVQSERKVVEVHVEKGMRHNQKITLRGTCKHVTETEEESMLTLLFCLFVVFAFVSGHADEEPGKEPGDLVFVLQQRQHELFTRRRSDLIMKKKITLLEALTGLKFVLTHLDGQKYFISSEPGEVIAVNAVKAVPELGMPLLGDPYTKGNLFIEFEIQFPADGSLTDAQAAVRCWGCVCRVLARSVWTVPTQRDTYRDYLFFCRPQLLASVLPNPSAVPALTDDMEPVSIKTINLEEEAAKSRARDREAYESDDDDGAGGQQQVRCAQQ